MSQRPRPPEDLVSMEGLTQLDRFIPAPDLWEWVSDCYIAEDGPFYFDGHSHLGSAVVGFLWTNCANTRRQRRIIGQAEMPVNGGNRGAWQKARTWQQLTDWFGQVPDFLITLDALWCDQAEDMNFCALIDHELTHCAQAEDEFGAPKFNKSTGLPEFCLKGHDIEEFISVVERFGIEAAGPEAVDMVIAAASKPKIGRALLNGACGTCAVRMAA